MQVQTGRASPEVLRARAIKVEQELKALRKELAATPTKVVKVPETSEPESVVNVDPYRPTTMDDLVGQRNLLRQLRLIVHGARLRGSKVPNVLLQGQSGGGKTTIAAVIADELQLPLIQTTGMVLRRPEDLVGLLVKQTTPALLMIDEVHAARRSALESIYTMLESGTLDLLGGGEASQHDVSNWVTVAASTHPGLLPPAFRNRFLSLSLDPYDNNDLAEIVRRVWGKRGMPFVDSEATEVAVRARNTPRVAVAYADRVLDYVHVIGADKVSEGTVNEALSVFSISPDGLTTTDILVLRVLTKDYAGKPVGLTALALQCGGLEESTITDTIEPYLISRSLILRTQRGRLATRAAYELMAETD